MAFSLAALFRRDKVQDPFGGDDLFDGGESRFAGQGPKIALFASAAMFVLLIGGGVAVFLTADPAAAPQAVVGTLSDLQVVEDEPVPARLVELAAKHGNGLALVGRWSPGIHVPTDSFRPLEPDEWHIDRDYARWVN